MLADWLETGWAYLGQENLREESENAKKEFEFMKVMCEHYTPRASCFILVNLGYGRRCACVSICEYTCGYTCTRAQMNPRKFLFVLLKIAHVQAPLF